MTACPSDWLSAMIFSKRETGMSKTPKDKPIEPNPKRGDALLRTMLKSKPKPHKEIVKERHEPKNGRGDKQCKGG